MHGANPTLHITWLGYISCKIFKLLFSLYLFLLKSNTIALFFQHILYAHGPWFVKQYGPLAIWNTQGMEKSHYRAKAAYFKNSRHGGGTTRSNALHEMFDWFYRCLSGRSYKATKAKKSSLAKAVREVTRRRRGVM